MPTDIKERIDREVVQFTVLVGRPPSVIYLGRMEVHDLTRWWDTLPIAKALRFESHELRAQLGGRDVYEVDSAHYLAVGLRQQDLEQWQRDRTEPINSPGEIDER